MTGVRLLGLSLCAATLTLAGAAGAAEYRENMPEVLGPSDEAPEVQQQSVGPSQAEIGRRFASAYRNAGEPRIAVFWNRTFSSRLSQWVSEGRLLVSREARVDAEERDPNEGTHSLSADMDDSVTAAGQRNVGQPRSGRPMGALANAEFEMGFTDPMLGAGARLIDRATIMRVTESNVRRQAGHDRASDAQIIETEALKGYADYIAEITMLADADAPRVRAFRVQVKRIPEGLIVANVLARGEKTSKESRTSWRAGEDGYEKVTRPETVSAVELGRSVALETMQALARAWR